MASVRHSHVTGLSNNYVEDNNVNSYGDFIDAVASECDTGGCKFHKDDTDIHPLFDREYRELFNERNISFGSRIRGFLNITEDLANKPNSLRTLRRRHRKPHLLRWRRQNLSSQGSAGKYHHRYVAHERDGDVPRARYLSNGGPVHRSRHLRGVRDVVLRRAVHRLRASI